MFSDLSNSSRKISLSPLRGIASIFALSGILICILVGIALWFFCHMSGWGDGATGNAIPNPTLTAILLTLPFFVYFLAGFIAALSTRQSVRIVMALIAHVCFLYMGGMFVLTLFLQAPFMFFAYVVVIIPLSLCWVKVLRNKQAEQVSVGNL